MPSFALAAIGRDVERISQRRLPDDEPLVGDMTFALEAGSIVSGYVEEPLVAFPFRPETVGARPRVLLGKQSGKASIDFKAAELGFAPLGDEDRAALLARVKESAQESGAMVSDDEFTSWLREVGAETRSS